MRGIVGFVIGTYALLYAAVNLPASRDLLTRTVARTLSEHVGAKVAIGDIEVGLFNRVTLRDVSLTDPYGRSLLSGRLISAKIALAPLFEGKISLHTIALLDLDVRLHQDQAGGPTNIQFLIDAFSSGKKKSSSKLDLRVNSLIVRRSHVSWDKRYEPWTDGRFDVNHLDLSDIDANVSLKTLTPDSLNLRVRNLRLRERSGLAVDKLTLRLAANRRRCDIEGFTLDLPESHVEQKELTLRYDTRDFLPSLRVEGELANSYVALSDLSSLLPSALARTSLTLDVTTRFNLSPDCWQFPFVGLRSRDGDLELRAEATLTRTGQRQIAAILHSLKVDASAVQRLYTDLTQRTVPQPLQAVGDVDLSGQVSYSHKRGVDFQGNLSCAAGAVAAQGSYRDKAIQARLSSNAVDLGKIALKPSLLGQASFDIEVAGQPRQALQARGTVHHVEMNEYDYRDIHFDGCWEKRRVTADLSVADPNLTLQAKTSFALPRPVETLQVDLNLADCAPGTLGWTDRFGDGRFSGRLTAALGGRDWKSVSGKINLEDFRMVSAADTFTLRHFALEAGQRKGHYGLTLDSDFARGQYTGDLSPMANAAGFGSVLAAYLPQVAAAQGLATVKMRPASFRLRVENTDILHRVLDIPFVLEGPFEAQGKIGDDGRLSLTAQTDGFDYAGTRMEAVKIYTHTQDDKLHTLIQGTKSLKNLKLRAAVEMLAGENQLRTDISWRDDRAGKYRGDLHVLSDFSRFAGEDREIDIHLLPSHVFINDSLWNVDRSRLNWSSRSLSIENFRLSHRDQSLALNGLLQPGTQDSLVADLNRVDIAYIMGLINFHAVEFAGEATGRVSLSNSLSDPHVGAELRIDNFLFNEAEMGGLYVQGLWNNEEKQVELNATMTESPRNLTYINGFISIARKGLDLRFRTVDTNLGFINRYVSGIFDDLRGRASGHLRLYGPFKELDLEGQQAVRMTCRVEPTNVDYTFSSDSVFIRSGEFDLRAVHITDRDGHSGRANGRLNHTHLRNLTYDFDITADHLLAYDRPKELDMPFFATAYASGTMHMEGRPGEFQADFNLHPDRGTTFTYIMDRPEETSADQFITFRDRNRLPAAADSLPAAAVPPTVGGTNILLNFLVDMTPEATMRVLMDEQSGDAIDVRGNGVIRASFYNKDGFKLYGSYNVAEGTYNLSLQDIIRKEFTLQSGSSITFNGDPSNSDLDLQAVYTVNSASLSDLNIGNNFTNNTVRVNCLLNVDGKVGAPQVSFDLDLPTVNEDEKQMVRNIISTEEDMNMQIIYLLSVGRFYTYDYGNTATASSQSQSSVAMKSFLSNTLTGQLNNIISNAIGSSNWSFGTNLSTGSVGWSDMEVEGLLSGRLLNNRLLINGNFGYRDRSTYSTGFVGDFDIQWLLTPAGSVSLKAYSETNDRYFTKSTLTTQGIGLILKRDFTRFSDLFRFLRPARKALRNDTTTTR